MTTILTKDYGHGITGRIELDEGGTESPISGDDAVKIAALHRRYINPNPECGTDVEELDEWARENAGEWEAFALFMYDHSGTIYKPSRGGSSPFSCPWDSGRVGFIFLKRSEFSGDLFDAATQICETYTAWANGEIYGYVLEDDDGEHLDSCWGYIGERDYCESEMDEAATRYVDKAQKREARAQEAERPDLYTVS
jgi:hypothetical protein